MLVLEMQVQILSAANEYCFNRIIFNAKIVAVRLT